MDMLNEMTIFAQVVASGSFSAAARHLGISIPAVSRHVARLETHLGGRLLMRTTRSLSLTELGDDVLAACKRIAETAQEVQALAGRYKSQPTGVLRVSAPVVIGQAWLAPQLPGFLQAYPDVDVRLTLIDRQVDLAEDGIDVAIRIARELAPGLVARPLCQLRYVLVASPAYLAQHGTPGSPDGLVHHACAYLGYGRFGADLLMIKGDMRQPVSLSSRITINNSGGLVAFAEAGGGIALVPEIAAEASLASGRLCRVLDEWACGEPYTGSIYAVYTPGRHLPLKVRAFIDHLAARLAMPADATA